VGKDNEKGKVGEVVGDRENRGRRGDLKRRAQRGKRRNGKICLMIWERGKI
jgi:hypothetical protein